MRDSEVVVGGPVLELRVEELLLKLEVDTLRLKMPLLELDVPKSVRLDVILSEELVDEEIVDQELVDEERVDEDEERVDEDEERVDEDEELVDEALMYAELINEVLMDAGLVNEETVLEEAWLELLLPVRTVELRLDVFELRLDIAVDVDGMEVGLVLEEDDVDGRAVLLDDRASVVADKV